MTRRGLDRHSLEVLLAELGRVAKERGQHLDLVVCGGAALILEGLVARATNDVDFVSEDIRGWRELELLGAEAATRIQELQVGPAWVDHGASRFAFPISNGPEVFSADGITVRRLDLAQILMMKLCVAKRGNKDRADAAAILRKLQRDGLVASRKDIERLTQPYRRGARQAWENPDEQLTALLKTMGLFEA